MDDVELSNVIIGTSDGPVHAGNVDSNLAERIGGKQYRVYLSKNTITKNRIFHPRITFNDYCKIQSILSNGFVALSHRKKRCLVFGYSDERNLRRPLKLVIKASKDGGEIFIETLHHIDRPELGRLIRQARKLGTLLRNPYARFLKK